MSFDGIFATTLAGATIAGAALGGGLALITGDWSNYAFTGTLAGAFIGATVGFCAGIMLAWAYGDD